MDYSDELKDPRWQRKRLEVMQADRFTCQVCFRSDKPLNVHHKKNIKGAKAWEYETNELITLCEDCHKKNHHEEKKIVCIGLLLENITDQIRQIAYL